MESADDDENRSELGQLVSDLNELISVSEENLLEMKRKELLSQLEDFEDDEAEQVSIFVQTLWTKWSNIGSHLKGGPF